MTVPMFTPAQDAALQESRAAGLELAPRVLLNSLELLSIDLNECSQASRNFGINSLVMLQSMTDDQVIKLQHIAEKSACTHVAPDVKLHILFDRASAELCTENENYWQLLLAILLTRGLCAVQQHWDQIKEIKAVGATAPTSGVTDQKQQCTHTY